MGRYCGQRPGWECPPNGLFECVDLLRYFEDPTRHPFLIQVGDELAGFVMIHKVGSTPDVDWNMGEFFVLSKFQTRGIGKQIAFEVFDRFQGIWEVEVMPDNSGALGFWKKVIGAYSKRSFSEELKTIAEPRPHPMRVLRFASRRPNNPSKNAYVVGVAGISGSGKTTLVERLGAALQATTLFWDNYDDISESPEDYVEWYERDGSYDAWKYPALEQVIIALKEGEKVDCPATQRPLVPTPHIIFDAPMGYQHTATGQHIDFLVYLDTPADIAMARRLLRDYHHSILTQADIPEELEFYLTMFRPLYIASYAKKEDSDLILDGSLPIDEQVECVLRNL